MTRTFEEMCAERDLLYAAMQPIGAFRLALDFEYAAQIEQDEKLRLIYGQSAIVALYVLTVRALRNKRQPYYDARQS